MLLNRKLVSYRQRTEREIALWLDAKIREYKTMDPDLAKLTRTLKAFVLRGGKRLRAILLIVSFKAFDGQVKDRNIFKFAAALELLHMAALIHDDLIDNDTYRRGQLTVHKKYAKELTGKIGREEAEKLGRDIAILAGDLLGALANELAEQTDFDDANKLRALEYYYSRGYMMGLGELMDVHLTGRKNISEEKIFNINFLKTVTYTTDGPVMIGGILAGASDRKLAPLIHYSKHIGSSFQIQDDLLGFFGRRKEIGKGVGSDWREGKVNTLIKKALNMASERDKKILLDYLQGKKHISINEARRVVRRSGCVSHIENKIGKDINSAKKCLDRAPIDTASKQLLRDIADYVISRDK